MFGTLLLLFLAVIVTKCLSNTELVSPTESSISNVDHQPEAYPSSAYTTSGFPSPTWSAIEEFCDWEAVNITCPDDDRVIIVRNARYGRLRVGRCVAKNYGHIGCGADVTSRLEAACSAKRRCRLGVISLHGTTTTCPSDLKAYIQLNYECVKVVTPQRLSCGRQQPGTATIAPTGGLIASVSATASTSRSDNSLMTSLLPAPPGSPTCPWALRTADYQRVRLTVIDFSKPSTGDKNELAFPVGGAAFPAPCVIVAERSTNGSGLASEKMVCGNGRDRETMAYKSTTNSVDIYIGRSRTGRQNLTGNEFIIKYEVFGCPSLLAPPGAHVILVEAEQAMLRCNDSRDVSWMMTCRDSQWVVAAGDVTGTCHRTPAVASLNPDVGISLDQSNEKDVMYGVMIIVSLGVAVGVTVGIMMLVLVLLYQRRYRQRKINCRADSYLMKRALSATEPPVINAHVTNVRIPSSGDGLTGCDDSLENQSNWRHANEFDQNFDYNIDHTITCSHGKGNALMSTSRYKDDSVMRHNARSIPGLPSTSWNRHTVTVSKSVPTWRDGCVKARQHYVTAPRQDTTTSPIVDDRRKEDLWDLCKRYGVVEPSVETSSQTIGERIGYHERHTVRRFELPLIGIDHLDLVGGFVDHSKENERVHFNCMTSPISRKTFAGAEFSPRHSSNTHVSGECLSFSIAGDHQHPIFFQTDPFADDSGLDDPENNAQLAFVERDCEYDITAETKHMNRDLNQKPADVENCLIPLPPSPLDVWMSSRERSPFYFKLDDAEFISSGYTMTQFTNK